MSTNNHHNKNCGFAEEIVAYLYGEIESPDKTRFEKHLDFCSNCDDELNSFGFVRSKIGDWRDEKFLPLKTPSIEIPFENREKAPEPILVSSKPEGTWWNGFKNLFAAPPVWGAVGLACLLVLVGLTLVIFNFSNGPDVAGSSDQPAPRTESIKKDVPVGSVLNKSEAPAEDQTASEKPAPVSESPEPIQVQQVPVRPANTRSPIRTERASKPGIDKKTPVKENPRPNEKTVAGQNLNPTGQPVQSLENLEVPKLSDIEEEEDDSLRLSDLFDEVGSD